MLIRRINPKPKPELNQPQELADDAALQPVLPDPKPEALPQLEPAPQFFLALRLPTESAASSGWEYGQLLREFRLD
jgi:hypothetical protein